MITIETAIKMTVDIENEDFNDYEEYEVGDGIEIITKNGNGHSGDIEAINSDSVIIRDDDIKKLVKIMFEDIAEVYNY